MIICSFSFLLFSCRLHQQNCKHDKTQNASSMWKILLSAKACYNLWCTCDKDIIHKKHRKNLFSLHLNPKPLTLSAKSWWQRWWTSFMESWSVETLMCIKVQPTFHCPNPHCFTKSRLLMMKMTNYDSHKSSWINHLGVKIQGTQYMMHIS